MSDAGLHTPGPWKITDEWAPGWRIAATVGNDTEDVAQITTMANARLIALAPELLALVVKAHQDLCGCQSMGDDCGWPSARNVILKLRP